MKHKAVVSACAALVVALGGMGLASDAEAARYRGTFDPNDGTYQWSGTHDFDVNDACLDETGAGATGWVAANDFTGDYGAGSCYVGLVGGTLSLEKLDLGGDPFTLNFVTGQNAGVPTFGVDPTVPPFDFLYDSRIFGVYFKDGVLAGVDTDWIGAFNFTPAETLALGLENFFLRWESGQANLDVYGQLQNGYEYDFNPLIDPVYLAACDQGLFQGEFNCDGEGGAPEDVTTGDARRATTVTFELFDPNTVPEPTTIALVLSALAGAGLARRRRRPAA